VWAVQTAERNIHREHRAVAAVLGQPTTAHIALPAHAVDRADDALTNPVLVATVTDLLNLADKLMPERAGEPHVSPADFQIGRADAHAHWPNQRLPGSGPRISAVRFESQAVAVKYQRLHNRSPNGRSYFVLSASAAAA
jgi:hypothetical protein